MKNKLFGLIAKNVYLLMCFLFVGVSLTVGLFYYSDQSLRKELLEQSKLLSGAVNLDCVKALAGTQVDLQSPDYRKLKNQFAAIHAANPRCRSAYLMGRRADGTVFFYLGVQDDHPESPPERQPGDICSVKDATPEFNTSFSNGSPFIEGPVSDELGLKISVLVPLIDSLTGQRIAVMGMDIPVREWMWAVADRASLPVAFVLLVLIGLGAVFVSAVPSVGVSNLVVKRLFPVLTGLLLVLFAIAGTMAWHMNRANMYAGMNRMTKDVMRDLQAMLKDQGMELSAVVHTIALDGRVRAALKDGDGARLLADWKMLFETLQRENGLTYFFFADAKHFGLAHLDQPDKASEQILQYTIREAGRTGRTALGIDMGLRLGTPVLRVVEPVFDGPTLLGYVGIGKELEEVLQTFRMRHPGIELAILIRKAALDREAWSAARRKSGREDDWDRLVQDVVIYASQGRVPDAFTVVSDSDPKSRFIRNESDGEVTDRGRFWRVESSALKPSSSSEVGKLMIMADITHLKAAFSRAMALSWAVAIVFLTTLLTIIFVLLNRTDKSVRVQQAKLHEKEALLSQAEAIAHTGSWSLDGKTHEFTWSDGCYRILGCEREEFATITYKLFLGVIHPDDRGGVDERYSASLLDEKDYHENNYRIVRRDTGESRYIHGQYIHTRDAEGVVIRTTGMVQDITDRKLAEETMRLSEEKFRSLFDSMTEMVALHELVFDAQGKAVNYRITDCNPAFTGITGLEAQEVIGRLATDIFKTETPPYLAEYAHTAITGEFKTFSTYFAPMNKSFEIRVFSPKKNFFATVTNDITEREQAENHREMVQDVLRILNEPADFQESIQHILAIVKERMGVDAVGLRLEEGEDFPYFAQDGFSDAFLRTENTLFQCNSDGRVCRDAQGKVSLECTCGLVLSGKTDPSSPLFTPGGSFWTGDSFPILDLPLDQDPRNHPRNTCMYEGYASMALVPIRTKDRIVGLLHLNAKAKGRFTLETIGLLEGVAAHVGSALMRKQSEKALQESEARFKALHNASLGGIAIHDMGLILDCNRGLSEITGYSFEELIGMDGLLLIAEPSRKMVRANIANREEKPYEGMGLRKNGEKYPVRLEGRNIPYKGKMVRSVEFRDLTEQKRLEAQLIVSQKMESVGRLAGGVAHDFNNMLQVMLGYTELALEQVSPDVPLYSDLEAIKHSAQHSAQLTQQLLAFARRQVVVPKVIDLNSAIAALLKMLQRLIGEDIDLAWRPADKVWPILMDPIQVDQILVNLCVNARDAIAGVGKITIETSEIGVDEESCTRYADFVPGAYVLLTVSDSGCGMDAETCSHVFEPFFSTKEFGKGTGLGLATVYGAVKQNHGFINVYSEPWQGTTFRIYLPRHVADLTTEIEEEEVAVLPPESIQGTETVLLVEDDAIILKATARLLDRLGYTVLAANTPADAIRLAEEKSGRIDLLLTDVVMPKMNGHDLATKLVALYPHLKCVFMSGYTAEVIAHQGILETGVHFLQKPFSTAKLGTKLREALEG